MRLGGVGAGAGGFVTRGLTLAALPLLFALTRFVRPAELAALRAALRGRRRAASGEPRR